MGPVAFQRISTGLDRPALLAAARRLTEAGIPVQAVNPGQGILIRSEHVKRATALLAPDNDDVE
ncbi:MAG: hypothetical protein AAF531_06610 [Actinomycetota bacterium]